MRILFPTTLHFVIKLIGAIAVVVAALFPIVNPLGSAPLFLSLTRGYPDEIREALVWRVSVNSFLLLLVSILVGSHVLHFFGVSIPVVQVAGGTIVAATGWSLLADKDTDSKRKTVTSATATQQAFYPLTLPVTVGPGSISVAVTLGANSAGHIYSLAYSISLLVSSIVGAFLVALSVYICYKSAERLERILGEVGMSVFLRLSAFIVICIGVQITWNGVAALVHTL